MKRTFRNIAAGIGLAAAWALIVVVTLPVAAKAEPAGPSFATCANLKGWNVNGDEESRRPIPTVGGLKFVGNDLIHHATDIALADLKPGTYTATPAPDQPSFFSVEVRSPSGAYGTLRWNPSTSKWSIVIGPPNSPNPAVTDGAFEGADPAVLLTGKVTKWGAFDVATTRVVSFGVGYTNSPAGTVDTVVTSVTFAGTRYDLTCAPAPSPSASESASVGPSGAASPGPGAGGSLPVTGVRTGVLIGGGLTVLAVGVGLVLLARRRVRFSA